MHLARENESLKEFINRNANENRKMTIMDSMPSSGSSNMAHLEEQGNRIMEAIQTAQRSFCITDPLLPDNPIIFASQGFLDMSGYKLQEVLGRNCRFLQGPGTDSTQVEILRNGIMQGLDTSVCLLNYRADGSQFYNQIFIAVLRDTSGKIINYVGVQMEVPYEIFII
jgi:PAS domain S-box-containing protein